MKAELSNDFYQSNNCDVINSNEYIFEFKTTMCLMFKQNGYLFIYAYKDGKDGQEIYLYDKFCLNFDINNFVGDNQLVVGELLIIGTKRVLIKSERYSNVNIEEFIASPQLPSLIEDIYINYFASEDIYDPEDFLPLIQS